MPPSPIPVILTSPPLPYYEHTLAVPKAAPGTDAAVPPPMFYGVTGFRIPSLAVVPTGYSQQPEMLVQQILYRFQRYVRELHIPGSRRSVALQ